ncbi:MAG: hypothetical protein Q9210_006109 [Variospora velana]
MNRRRHAILPDEADYLTKILPTLNMDSHRETSLPKHSQEHNSEAHQMKAFNPLDTRRFSLSTWKNPSLTSTAIKDDPALPAHFHHDQQPDPGSGSIAPDEQARSPRSSSRVPPDNKRKYGAISDEEDDKMDVSPTAIDIVHPSELRPPEIDDSEYPSIGCGPFIHHRFAKGHFVSAYADDVTTGYNQAVDPRFGTQ